MFRYLSVLLLLSMMFITTGCASFSGYARFYQPYVDLDTVPTNNFIPLLPGQDPELHQTSNIKKAMDNAIRQGFIVVGSSSFNGSREAEWTIEAQAKKVGATHVIYAVEHTSTEQNTLTMAMPDNKTTYQSGTVNAQTYGYGGYSSSSYGTYSGSSTTYGTQYVPITTTTRRYDQGALFLVRVTNEFMRVGIRYQPLTPEMRKALERNQGIYVTHVVDKTPAFYGNIIEGDVLIEIGGIRVMTMEDVSSAIDLLANNSIAEVKVIRNGEPKLLEIDLSKNDMPSPVPAEKIERLKEQYEEEQTKSCRRFPC